MVDRRETGIREGRLRDGVVEVLARETGRGMCEGDRARSGSLRSESRGVDGRDSGSPLLPITTQLSAVRNRFAIRGRSSETESIDRTP